MEFEVENQLKLIVGGKARQLAVDRKYHLTANRKEQLMLLTSHPQNGVVSSEKFTCTSVRAALDVVMQIEGKNDFKRDFRITDYSIFNHNSLTYGLNHSRYEWYSEKYDLQEEKIFQQKKKLPEVKKVPENTERMKVRLADKVKIKPFGECFKNIQIDQHSSKPEQIVAKNIKQYVMRDIQQKENKKTVQNVVNLRKLKEEQIENVKIIKDVLGYDRKDIMHPDYQEHNPKVLFDRIFYEMYEDSIEVVEANIPEGNQDKDDFSKIL